MHKKLSKKQNLTSKRQMMTIKSNNKSSKRMKERFKACQIRSETNRPKSDFYNNSWNPCAEKKNHPLQNRIENKI